MYRYWYIYLIIIFLLGISISFFYPRYKKQEITNEISVVPAEIFDNFDPTTNPSVFIIEGSDSATKELNLMTIFPSERHGIKTQSKVTCTNINIDEMFLQIEKGLNNQMTLSGICKDKACTIIDRDCDLLLISK